MCLQNLSTLVENGVSLPHALDTVAQDRSLKKYQQILKTIGREVNSGRSLSAAMKKFPLAFNEGLINQIQVGERSGELDSALIRVAAQLEQASSQISFIMKKLT
ncbi:MAG: type II secretion system F family protein, partial [Planctomycetales bacterium]|nr:type II secretion system F family protein [Planctomycetales bacterium]